MMKTLVNPSSTDSRNKTLSVLNPQKNNRTTSRSTLDIVLIIHHAETCLCLIYVRFIISLKNRLLVRIASVRHLPQRDTHNLF